MTHKLFAWVGVSAVAPCTLTIESGAVVKFAHGAGLNVYGGCNIVAKGAIFTSLSDDAHGGDTDGVPGSIAAPGDWQLIWVAGADGSSFDGCEILYAGDTYGEALRLSAITSVTGSTVAHTAGTPLAYFPSAIGALNATDAPPGTVIAGNTLYDNDVPLTVNQLLDIDASNAFHDPLNPAMGNARNRIDFAPSPVRGNPLDIVGPRAWSQTEVPIFVGGLTVGPTGTLTLAPGVTLKFGTTTDLNVQGSLIALGTASAPILFTSYRDASHGGDTWGGGAPTPPAGGDWYRITLSGAGSELSHCSVLYAGYFNGNALKIDGTSASITDCTVAHTSDGNWHSGPYGYAAALDAWNATTGTVIAGDVFFDNAIPLGVNGSFDIGITNTFHDPAAPGTTNLLNGVFFDSTVVAPASLPTLPARTLLLAETEVPFVADGLSIPTGATMNLGAGVVLAITAGRPISLDGGSLAAPSGSATARAWVPPGGVLSSWAGLYRPADGTWLNSQTTATTPFIVGLSIVNAANGLQ